MSSDQVADLREKLVLVELAVARIETRQSVVLDMLERSQASLGEYHGRLRIMENEGHMLRTKLWLAALVAGACFAALWEMAKRRLGF